MKLESKMGPKNNKKDKKMFCKLEFFFSCYFFIIPFLLHFKYDFQILR
jgi:hypothetical protein